MQLARGSRAVPSFGGVLTRPPRRGAHRRAVSRAAVLTHPSGVKTAMSQYGSELDDGSSLAGSPANSTLTGDKLRRRPAHSRKASIESLDLENDTLLPAALERLQILAGSAQGRPPRRRSEPSAKESVASVDDGISNRDASSGESSRVEVTSVEKPNARGAGDSYWDKIRSIVASGGAFVDTPDGSRRYEGGDTRLRSIKRGCDFETLLDLLDVPLMSSTRNDDSGERNAKPRVFYRDPNDASMLIRIARDADIDEMFEEWDRRVRVFGRERNDPNEFGFSEKLRVYVVAEKTGSADSEPGSGSTPRSRGSPNAVDRSGSMRDASREISASASSGLQNIPSAELTVAHRLGGGAFGEVHLALWRGSEVAVKFLRAAQPARFRRFGAASRRRRNRGDPPDANDREEDRSRSRSRDEEEAEEDAEAEAAEAEAAEVSILSASESDDSEDDSENREALASRERFLKEAKVMAALHHPNVVFVYGVVDDGERLGIVEEFLRSGSLRRLLNLHAKEARDAERAAMVVAEDGDGNLLEGPHFSAAVDRGEDIDAKKKPRGKRTLRRSVRARCALDIARGMAYLHSRRFVHFDLKCDNVMTARRLGLNGGVACKVADFGLSKHQRGGGGSVAGGGIAGGSSNRGTASGRVSSGPREFVSGVASQRGTLPWTAPELFSDPQSATERVDVYSFGVTMWELWTCDVPFHNMLEQSVVWGIMTGKRPEVPSDEEEPCPGWLELMTSAWADDPNRRPTFDEIVTRLERSLGTGNPVAET